ncbi:MAG: NUDIX domain-containing protein [Ruminococcus sp.]|nr:NUDIX domain-containing protein [Ruminococcus sp.]
MSYDCCFTHDNNWFRYRVGAIIIEDDCVLFVKNNIDDYYYSVGGGVHMNEEAQDAIVREVYEETGVKYEIDHLAVIHENFFSQNSSSLKGLTCHEISLYYLMKSRGTKKLNSNSYNSFGAKEEMCFLPLDKLEDYTVYPSFIKDNLQQIKDGIVHIITRDNKNYIV